MYEICLRYTLVPKVSLLYTLSFTSVNLLKIQNYRLGKEIPPTPQKSKILNLFL